MSLLNPAMLAGLGLAAIPVLLHLLLRAKPKRLLFPAASIDSTTTTVECAADAIAVFVVADSSRGSHRINRSGAVPPFPARCELHTQPIRDPDGPNNHWRGDWRLRRCHAVVEAAESVQKHLADSANIAAGSDWWCCRVVDAVGSGLAVRSTGVGRDQGSHATRCRQRPRAAAVFLFDTSPSMSYRQANKTRLRVAQEMAKEHLGHLPMGSKVAVASSSETMPAAFSSDLIAAQGRFDAQEIKSTSLPLSDRLRTILVMEDEDRRRVTNEQSSVPEGNRQDKFVREVYLFTDLAKSEWREDPALREELVRLKGIGVYLIDVGELEPNDVALTSPKLSREAVPNGGLVRIDAVVSSVGTNKPNEPAKSEQVVEVYLRGPDGNWSKPVGPETVKLEHGSESRVTFSFPIELGKEGYRQGELRLVGSDPLSVDDIVSFTVQGNPTVEGAGRGGTTEDFGSVDVGAASARIGRKVGIPNQSGDTRSTE